MGHESVVVLFKGGRAPSWYALTAGQHDEYQRLHVDLMLSVAREHGMTRLEGYRLVGTQQLWRLFWVIEFPTVEGAEAWIDAEIEPPYGAHGQFEYHLARRWAPGHLEPLVTGPPALRRRPGVDPHEVPRWTSTATAWSCSASGGTWRRTDRRRPRPRTRRTPALSKGSAGQHGLTRLEGFRLLTPQPEWQLDVRGRVSSLRRRRGVDRGRDGARPSGRRRVLGLPGPPLGPGLLRPLAARLTRVVGAIHLRSNDNESRFWTVPRGHARVSPLLRPVRRHRRAVQHARPAGSRRPLGAERPGEAEADRRAVRPEAVGPGERADRLLRPDHARRAEARRADREHGPDGPQHRAGRHPDLRVQLDAVPGLAHDSRD